MSEALVRLLDDYFPHLEIRSRNSHDLNRNLHWYAVAANLKDLGEPAITAPRGEGAEFVRFTWYSAWGELFFVRMERAGGRIRLESGERDGKARVGRDLEEKDWTELTAAIDAAGLTLLEAHIQDEGVDGAWYVLEQRRTSRLWHAERWCPTGSYRDVCERMTRLAGRPPVPR